MSSTLGRWRSFAGRRRVARRGVSRQALFAGELLEARGAPWLLQGLGHAAEAQGVKLIESRRAEPDPLLLGSVVAADMLVGGGERAGRLRARPRAAVEAVAPEGLHAAKARGGNGERPAAGRLQPLGAVLLA